MANVVPQFLQAQEEERRYQLAKQRAASEEAMRQQEMAQSSEAFGWQREQHARLKALQDSGLGVSDAEEPGGPSGANAQPAFGPQQAETQGPTQGGQPMAAQQAIGGSDSDFEGFLRGQMATTSRIAQNLIRLDPERGMEFAARHMEESRQQFQALALEHARTKALDQVSSGVAHGEYDVPLLSGQGSDPTYSEIAKSKLAQLQIPGTDPRPILSELDDLKAKAHLKSVTNTQLATRMASAEQDVKKRVEEHKPADADGVARLIDLARRGAITPDQWDAQIDDALHGRTDLKENYAKLQAEHEAMSTELEKANVELSKSRAGYFTQRGNAEEKKGNLVLPGKALSGDRQYFTALQRAEQEYSAQLGPIMASQDKGKIADYVAGHDKFVKGRTQEILGEARGAVGGPAPGPQQGPHATPASDLIRDFRAGKISDRNQFNSLLQQNGWVDAQGNPSLEALEAAAARE